MIRFLARRLHGIGACSCRDCRIRLDTRERRRRKRREQQQTKRLLKDWIPR